MAKSKKKRSKKYRGSDAKSTRPVVTKVSVPSYSKPARWWNENRRKVQSRLFLLGLGLILVGLTNWLLRLVF